MDDRLEAVIAALVERKNAAVEGSAEYRLAIRLLTGLRYTRELAGPIIEELDPCWGSELAAALARDLYKAVTPQPLPSYPKPVCAIRRPADESAEHARAAS